MFIYVVRSYIKCVFLKKHSKFFHKSAQLRLFGCNPCSQYFTYTYQYSFHLKKGLNYFVFFLQKVQTDLVYTQSNIFFPRGHQIFFYFALAIFITKLPSEGDNPQVYLLHTIYTIGRYSNRKLYVFKILKRI